MAQSIRDVMTPNPMTVDAGASLADVARTMREGDVGAVIVTEGDRITGIVTDRDIVVRAIAEGREPAEVSAGEVASIDLTTLSPGDSVDDAVSMMRQKALRRLPVVENGKPVGIVSIGDLAIARDPGEALADISKAPPNA